MPIYEYQCKSCGHRLEALQKLSDAALVDCPECSTAALTRLISATSFRLKGGGWYETDFKTGSKRHGAGSESGAGDNSGTRQPAKETAAASAKGEGKKAAAESSKSGSGSASGSGNGAAGKAAAS